MAEYKLRFNGYKIILVENGVSIKSWDAISGRPGYQSPIYTNQEKTGPLPEGKWVFNTSQIQIVTVKDDVVGTISGVVAGATGIDKFKAGTWFGGTNAWGLERVFLSPIDGTDTKGRTNFSIHGGDQYGSAGCIDLGHSEVDFFRTLTEKNIGNVVLDVSYDSQLANSAHPLAGAKLGTGLLSRGTEPQDHLGRTIPLTRCFLAGTPILMADGSEKPIEQVRPGDLVMAFDSSTDGGRGAMIPRPVTRAFQNDTRQIVDLHGLLCTPGHVFLTGEIDARGRGVFETVGTILRKDGTLVNEDGTLIRARTGAPVGSMEDIAIRVAFRDPKMGTEHVAVIRAGVPTLIASSRPALDGAKRRSLSLAQWLTGHGVEMRLDGTLRTSDGVLYEASDWPEGSTPFDLRETQNWVVRSQDGELYTPPWIADLADEDERVGLRVVGGMEGRAFRGASGLSSSASSRIHPGSGRLPLSIAAAPSFSSGTNLKPIRASGTNSNRAERRRLAALKRVPERT